MLLLNMPQKLQQTFEVSSDVPKAFGEGTSILSLVSDTFQILDDLYRRSDESDNTGRDAQRIHVKIPMVSKEKTCRDNVAVYTRLSFERQRTGLSLTMGGDSGCTDGWGE